MTQTRNSTHATNPAISHDTAPRTINAHATGPTAPNDRHYSLQYSSGRLDAKQLFKQPAQWSTMMRSGILVRLKQCSHKRSNSSQTTNATSSSTKQHSHSRPNQPSNAPTGSGEPIRPAIQPDSRFSQPGIGTDKSHGRTSHPFQSPRPSYPVKLASPAVSFQLAKPTTSSQLPVLAASPQLPGQPATSPQSHYPGHFALAVSFGRVAPATRPTSQTSHLFSRPKPVTTFSPNDQFEKSPKPFREKVGDAKR